MLSTWSALCVDLPGSFISVVQENWFVCFFAMLCQSWAACQRQSHIWWLMKGVTLRFFLVNTSPEARRLCRLPTPDRALVGVERLLPRRAAGSFFTESEDEIGIQKKKKEKRNCCSQGSCGMGLLISVGSERAQVPREMKLVFQIFLRITSALNKAFLALSLLVWRLGSPGRIYALLH